MSNGWKVYWAIVAVTITNYLLMILWSLPKISQMAGGRVPFDMRPGGYSFECQRQLKTDPLSYKNGKLKLTHPVNHCRFVPA